MKHSIRALALATLCVSALAASSTAVAQSCKITPTTTPIGVRWDTDLKTADVADYGDLKIRAAEVIPGGPGEVVLDIKAPGIAYNGMRFHAGQSIKFNACGQEITVIFRNYTNVSYVYNQNNSYASIGVSVF